MTVFQLTSSICQPVIGYFTDKRPFAYSLPLGMTSTLFGILLFANAWNFPVVLLSVAMIGLGSAVFHPEAARLTYMAAGNRPGFAQSSFKPAEIPALPSVRSSPPFLSPLTDEATSFGLLFSFFVQSFG